MASNADDGDAGLERFQNWFKASKDISHKWRIEAREDYDFVAGNQWSDDDTATMKTQQRPVVTFNRTASIVDSVCGLEVTNRQEVRYIPRTLGKSGVNDLLTGAAQWVRDECNAEDEESDAFVDLITCGMGWTETRLDYDEDPEGKLLVLRVDPLEMFWDASARRRNLADAKHMFRVKDVSVGDAEDMFPDADIDDLNAQWAIDDNAETREPHDAMLAPFYIKDQSPDTDKQTYRVRLVEVQWWEHEKAYRVIDPATKKAVTLSPKDFKVVDERAKALGIPITSAKFKRKKYHRAILGSKVLKEWDGPEEGGFTYKCLTGKRDRNQGTWYGMVRAMIDPQKWANKWLAQVMYIINTNAKGGILAEADAFDNPQQAKDEWSDPSAVTIVSNGALAGDKIRDKPQVQYPAGIDRLMQFAISSIRDVSGVSLELLGMANKEQPGILEHQRKQAGMTILAGLFDSLRHYRKDQGRLMLYYITNYLSDGRLIRIGGPEDAQYVPLVKQPGLAEYDVIVDDAPTSPNQKEQTWGILQQMFPVLAKMQVPLQVWMEFLEYSPLPASLVSKFKDELAQATQKQPQQDPKMIEAQAKAQAAAVTAQSKAQTEAARAQIHVADAHASMAAAAGESVESNARAFNDIAQGLAAMAKVQTDKTESDASAVESILSGLAVAHKATHPPKPATGA